MNKTVKHVSINFLGASVDYADFGDGFDESVTKLIALLFKMEFDFDVEFWSTEVNYEDS